MKYLSIKFTKLCKSYLKTNFHFLIVFVIIFFFLTSYNNENGFHFNHKTIFLKSSIPQGWAFFTRNARENQINIYSIKKNKLACLNENSSLNLNLALGLKRTDRRISIIMGNITKKPIKWKTFVSKKKLLDDYEFNKYLINNGDDSKLKPGKYILISEKRIPWAWAKNFKTAEKKYYKFIVE